MATGTYRTVSSDGSERHDEPHIERSRITVRYVHERVEGRGLRPETVTDRHSLAVVDVYEALAYYHNNPEEKRRERLSETAEEDKTISAKNMADSIHGMLKASPHEQVDRLQKAGSGVSGCNQSQSTRTLARFIRSAPVNWLLTPIPPV